MIEKERARRILAAEQEAYDEARNNTHDLQMQQADITIQKIEAQTAVEKSASGLFNCIPINRSRSGNFRGF